MCLSRPEAMVGAQNPCSRCLDVDSEFSRDICLTLDNDTSNWINRQPESISEDGDSLKVKLTQASLPTTSGRCARSFLTNVQVEARRGVDAEYFEVHYSVSQTLLSLQASRLSASIYIEQTGTSTAILYTLPKHHLTNEPPRISLLTASFLPQPIL